MNNLYFCTRSPNINEHLQTLMDYQPTIDKETLQDLPLEKFTGRIHLYEADAIPSEVAAAWLREPLIGFDTESKPVFVRGTRSRVSLIQLATADECWLVRLAGHPFPKILADLFNTPKVTKVGLSSKDDFHQLRAVCPGLAPQGVVELQSMVRDYGIEEMSLQKIYAILFGLRISKAQRLSNWEAEELTEAQQQYAALDAWAVRQIYLRLKGKI